MASATRIRRVEYKVKRGAVMRKSQTAQRRATQELAKQMQARLRKVLDVQGTPKMRSRPGQPPRKQSGDLQRDTTVKQEGRTLVVRTRQYGTWLDGGFVHYHSGKVVRRKWLRKNIHDKQAMWDRKWKALMKRFMK